MDDGWTPPNPSKPDGEREHLFVPLADVAPELATTLIDKYIEHWLELSDWDGKRESARSGSRK